MSTAQPRILLLGLNHTTAGVEVREKFALTECLAQGETVIPPDDVIAESMVLSTCNRVEILVVGHGGRAEELTSHTLARWAEARGQDPKELAPYTYAHEGLSAVRHVFSVASSLDSMVLGEPQILGQLKDAYKAAVKTGTTRVVLNRLLHKAFSVAKRVRTETDIGSSAVSISYAAVELAKRIFGEMDGRTAMLIGAGEMAELAATHLITSGLSHILVANRTFARAQKLAETFASRNGREERLIRGEPVLFEDLFHRLPEVDIVISSTGASEAVIRAKDVKATLKARKNKPMFFIDIAVPRDVDPDVNTLDNVYLYDIDDLKDVVEENLAQRQEEAAKARAIVAAETEGFGKWLCSLDVQPTIVDLLQHGEELAERELAKTMKRLGPVNGETERALAVLTRSLVQKLYHEPILYLKRRAEEEDASEQSAATVRKLFNLDEEDHPSPSHAHRRLGQNLTGEAGQGHDSE